MMALITSLSGSHFSGPRDIIVEPGATKNYTLAFKPDWVTQSEGQLLLVNTVTSEKYQYTLKGVAEDPLAEGHLVVSCQARWRVIESFPVRSRRLFEGAQKRGRPFRGRVAALLL